jgi:AcrR family transcriptional regulator
MACASPHQPVRADGIDARHRLLVAGLALFAEHGFDRTSVRALARQAQVNVGAISYYFGDKEGLYRALFAEPPIGDPQQALAFADPSLSVPEAMRRYYAYFLEPLKLAGDEVRRVMKLHFREMAEPTGAWTCALDNDIRPQHEAMRALLVRALGLRRADADVERLAVAIAGLAVHVFAFRDGVQTLTPRLLETPRAIDAMAERLAGYAVSMVDGERARRASARREAARREAARREATGR